MRLSDSTATTSDRLTRAPLPLSPELYRISTFARFPSSGVTERSLARAGWFYTGIGDRVQCFRCNVTAEGWQPGDCPTEKHRHLSPSCTFIQSLPSTANLLSSSHSAFSPLRVAPAIPVRAEEICNTGCDSMNCAKPECGLETLVRETAKLKKIFLEGFDDLMRWFFHTYPYRGVSQKCHGNAFLFFVFYV